MREQKPIAVHPAAWRCLVFDKAKYAALSEAERQVARFELGKLGVPVEEIDGRAQELRKET